MPTNIFCTIKMTCEKNDTRKTENDTGLYLNLNSVVVCSTSKISICPTNKDGVRLSVIDPN